MKIELKKLTVRELSKGYVDNAERFCNILETYS